MPTAAKLAGLVFFAALGAVIALYVPRLLPPGMARGMLFPVTVGIAGITGWRVAGRALERGKGLFDSVATGMRTAVVALFFVLLAFACGEMVKQAFRKVYDGPVEAVVGVFEELIEFLPMLADPPFIALLLGGGAIAGVLTGMIGRRWR